MTCAPNPAPAIWAKARPIRPAPTMPTVLPAMSLASHFSSGQAQPSARMARSSGISFFARASIRVKAPSATVRSAYSGMLTTGMPRARAACTSMASMPTPYLTMPFSLGAAAITRSVIGV